MVGQEPLARQRKKHTRSRTGCFPCREKHVRCDEKKPRCANCTATARACEYPLAGQVLRDRGTREKPPGVLAPWQLGPPQDLGKPLDPFSSLPIGMPLRSLELLKYYFGTNPRLNASTFMKDSFSVSGLAEDAVLCRSVLIFAGLHYAGSHGGMHSLTTSYLHHKVQCIQRVNSWIADGNARITAPCLRLIGTLCISEICLGSTLSAMAQIEGLLMLYHLRVKEHLPNMDAEIDVLERYILIALGLLELKREVHSPALSGTTALNDSTSQSLLDDPAILDTLRLLPYYLRAGSALDSPRIDVYRVVLALRSITFALASSSPGSTGPTPSLGVAHAKELIMAMILGATQLHVSSLTGTDTANSQDGQDQFGQYISNWTGMAAACILYITEGPLHSQQRVNGPTQFCVLTYLTGAIIKDLETTVAGLYDHDLWLWKVFVVLLAVVRSQHESAGDHERMQGFQRFLNKAVGLLSRWREATGTVDWERVKDALYRVAWADGFPEQQMEGLWHLTLMYPSMRFCLN